MARDFGAFFKTVGGGEGSRCNYPTRLDTYGCGCQHDCAYCYAKSLLSFRGLWNASEPSVASTEYISRALRKVRPGTILRLGGMSDPFQPLERVYGATFQLIRMLNARGIGYLIVTKSGMVAERDYMRLLDPELAHVQITVTSTEGNPLGENAPKPEERLGAAVSLSKAGFDVSVRLSPYIPEYVDTARLGASWSGKVLVEFLRVNHWVREWTGRSWPQHSVSSGGYMHLPLEEKARLLDGLDGFELSVCEDVPGHYEFFRDNVNANPDDCCNLRRA